MLTNALQARGAATESLIVNISRQGLICIPSMFILGAIFHETGLIWAQPVADVLSLLLGCISACRVKRTIKFKRVWDYPKSHNSRLSRRLYTGTHLKMHRKILHLHHPYRCPQVGKTTFTACYSKSDF